MEKIDYKKQMGELYSGKVGKPVVVNVPPMNYLKIDGKGDPNTSQNFVDAIETLYPLAYTIKFLCKNKYGHDFGVMPLEGLWWAEDMANFTELDKSEWLWTLMIMQPPIVDSAKYQEALENLLAKKQPKLIDKVRFEAYNEGRSAQVLYVGPYSDETETIANLHQFIKDQGGSLKTTDKQHHEIYLSDARRTDPSKLKTIIRQPF